MFFRVLFVVFLQILSAVPSFAEEWVVERAVMAKFFDGKTWFDLRAGMELPNSAWVQTGPRGRVLVTRGSERIMLNPGTMAAISTWNAGGPQTKVTQRSGSVLLDVETRRRKHTRVVTPHLAAVVKGTMFEVTTGRNGSSVRVERGVVSVSSESSGQSADVSAGNSAVVDTRRGGALTVGATGSTQDSSDSWEFDEETDGNGNNGNGNGNGNGKGNNGNGKGNNGNGNGNGNNGNGNNGNGNGNGNNGNGNNGNGNGNGNNGNGNGNGNNGNGNGNGNNGNNGNGGNED